MPFSKYSPKQKKLAAVAKPRNKITGADLAKLRKKKKRVNTQAYQERQGLVNQHSIRYIGEDLELTIVAGVDRKLQLMLGLLEEFARSLQAKVELEKQIRICWVKSNGN